MVSDRYRNPRAVGIARPSIFGKVRPRCSGFGCSYDDVLAQVSNSKFARRQLSGLLLDQGFLAGVGNYLRSEILFAAGISPYRKTGSLSDEELHQLAKSAIEITALAYHEKGVTVPQELYQALRDNGLSRYQARHYVFTRDGLECHNCQSLIVHTRLQVVGWIIVHMSKINPSMGSVCIGPLNPLCIER